MFEGYMFTSLWILLMINFSISTNVNNPFLGSDGAIIVSTKTEKIGDNMVVTEAIEGQAKTMEKDEQVNFEAELKISYKPSSDSDAKVVTEAVHSVVGEVLKNKAVEENETEGDIANAPVVIETASGDVMGDPMYSSEKEAVEESETEGIEAEKGVSEKSSEEGKVEESEQEQIPEVQTPEEGVEEPASEEAVSGSDESKAEETELSTPVEEKVEGTEKAVTEVQPPKSEISSDEEEESKETGSNIEGQAPEPETSIEEGAVEEPKETAIGVQPTENEPSVSEQSYEEAKQSTPEETVPGEQTSTPKEIEENEVNILVKEGEVLIKVKADSVSNVHAVGVEKDLKDFSFVETDKPVQVLTDDQAKELESNSNVLLDQEV